MSCSPSYSKGSRDFWWQLANEERNHAALLQSGKDEFVQQSLFPAQMLCAEKGGAIFSQTRNPAIRTSCAQKDACPPLSPFAPKTIRESA